MALSLQEYFDIRCSETFDALGNMQVLFADLQQHVRDDQLKALLQQQHEAIQQELHLFAQITNNPTPEQMPTHVAQSSDDTEQPLVMVGRTWTGTVGRSTVEHYRVYVTRVPQPVLDVNSVMLSEEVCHFNLGNYTGLIVLAKELDQHETADRIQTCIDHQVELRSHIEDSLWQVIRTQHHRESPGTQEQYGKEKAA